MALRLLKRQGGYGRLMAVSQRVTGPSCGAHQSLLDGETTQKSWSMSPIAALSLPTMTPGAGGLR